jgi:hypothetical protein
MWNDDNNPIPTDAIWHEVLIPSVSIGPSPIWVYFYFWEQLALPIGDALLLVFY